MPSKKARICFHEQLLYLHVFIGNKGTNSMIGRMFFKLLSESSKIAYLQEKGTVLGTRLKNGRKAYLYMIKDFCVEVIFRQDNEEMAPEQVTTFASVQEFNSYLEREFRTAY